MLKFTNVRLVATLIALAAALVVGRMWGHAPAPVTATASASAPASGAPATTPATTSAPTAAVAHPEIGFHSRERLEEHWRKHGSEFGAASPEDYLRLAQTLRDRPVGGNMLEQRRSDGVSCRFDRASGAFLAFDQDLTIRTFFRPNDGERYFQRQLEREH